MVPLATNGTIGKITNCTIGKPRTEPSLTAFLRFAVGYSDADSDHPTPRDRRVDPPRPQNKVCS